MNETFMEILTPLLNGNRGDAKEIASEIKNTYNSLAEEWESAKQKRRIFAIANKSKK